MYRLESSRLRAGSRCRGIGRRCSIRRHSAFGCHLCRGLFQLICIMFSFSRMPLTVCSSRPACVRSPDAAATRRISSPPRRERPKEEDRERRDGRWRLPLHSTRGRHHLAASRARTSVRKPSEAACHELIALDSSTLGSERSSACRFWRTGRRRSTDCCFCCAILPFPLRPGSVPRVALHANHGREQRIRTPEFGFAGTDSLTVELRPTNSNEQVTVNSDQLLLYDTIGSHSAPLPHPPKLTTDH